MKTLQNVRSVIIDDYKRGDMKNIKRELQKERIEFEKNKRNVYSGKKYSSFFMKVEKNKFTSYSDTIDKFIEEADGNKTFEPIVDKDLVRVYNYYFKQMSNVEQMFSKLKLPDFDQSIYNQYQEIFRAVVQPNSKLKSTYKKIKNLQEKNKAAYDYFAYNWLVLRFQLDQLIMFFKIHSQELLKRCELKEDNDILRLVNNDVSSMNLIEYYLFYNSARYTLFINSNERMFETLVDDLMIKKYYKFKFSLKMDDTQSTESLGALVVLTLTFLGLMLILPLGRWLTYKLKTMRVDLSKFYKHESDMLVVNVEIIKAKLDRAKDPKERKKLITIIEKQEKFIEKFDKISTNWYTSKDDMKFDTVVKEESETDQTLDDEQIDEPTDNADMGGIIL